LQVPADPVCVRFDEQGFKLVLSNLVSNAVKYTANGSVGIRLERTQDGIQLRVRDSGMGIPAGDLPKMFKEFFRASNARKSNIKGTGVGLAGVKEIVERFGGSIEMQSEEGIGSEFTVKLPLGAGA
ncbi:MAG: HAMP domain-containing histidine kinase, partial [Lentisphaerae bacterium]|nr:HAMP domain-containing histidine kinase [Lentisphaerota bacterium]